MGKNWAVEQVVGKRFREDEMTDEMRVFYLIKWENWPESSNTWEPEDNCASCPALVERFEQQLIAGEAEHLKTLGGPEAVLRGRFTPSRRDPLEGIDLENPTKCYPDLDRIQVKNWSSSRPDHIEVIGTSIQPNILLAASVYIYVPKDKVHKASWMPPAVPDSKTKSDPKPELRFKEITELIALDDDLYFGVKFKPNDYFINNDSSSPSHGNGFMNGNGRLNGKYHNQNSDLVLKYVTYQDMVALLPKETLDWFDAQAVWRYYDDGYPVHA